LNESSENAVFPEAKIRKRKVATVFLKAEVLTVGRGRTVSDASDPF
jgi:hypothetical protein